jgi:hypothetical protein
VQAVKEQLRGYEKGVVAGTKKKSGSIESEMAVVQAQLKGYSEVRLKCIIQMLSDCCIDAIWRVRGGHKMDNADVRDTS